MPQEQPEAQGGENGSLFGPARYVDEKGRDVTEKVEMLKAGGVIKAEVREFEGIGVFAESLLRIKQTMLEAGCETCAAMIVLNAELRKWGGYDGRP